MSDTTYGQLHQRPITSAFNYNRTYSITKMFCCSWDRTGRLLATVCRDRQLRLVEARTGEVTASTRGPGSHQARLSKVGSSNFTVWL